MAHIEYVNVDVRVQSFQLLHAKAVIEGQSHEGIAGLDRVGGFLGAVGTEQGAHFLYILIDPGGRVLLGDAHPRQETGGHRVLRLIGLHDLVQHGD